jgi:hypothetical protein
MKATLTHASRSQTAPVPSVQRALPPSGGLGNQALQTLLLSGTVQAGPAPAGSEVIGSPVPQGGGQPLPQPLRGFFEPRFGRDLGHVRLHTDSRATENAKALQARAYAVGSDIVMARGEYAPATDRGKWLLAHEIAHVVQARSAPSSSSPSVASVERDAEQAATSAVTGRPVHLQQYHDGRRLHRFGEPQHVPQTTYIAGQDPVHDGFLRQATTYHQTWGLSPQPMHALEEIIDDLSSGTGTIDRIRIVTHASQSNLYTALFTGGPLGITKDLLLTFGQNNQQGLRLLTGPLVGQPLVDQVLSHIRTTNVNVLQPFGLETPGSVPAGAVAELISRSVALLMFQRGTGGSQQQTPVVTTALETQLSGLRQQVQSPAPGGAGVTAAQARALQDAITGLTAFQLTRPTLGAATIRALTAANTAIGNDFRTKLNRVRTRFRSSSWIDIRGCNAGTDLSYLRAVADFFGMADQKPHVSAPDLFQSFPTLAYRAVQDRRITEWARNADVQAALGHWASVTGVYERFLWWRGRLLEILARDFAQRSAGGASGLTFSPPPLLGGLVGVMPMSLGLSLPSFEELRLQEPGLRPSGPATQFLQNSLVTWARAELARLTRPDALLRYYLESELVLPVQNQRDPRRITLFMKQGLEDPSMDNWLASVWAEAAPGLTALQSGRWNAADARQVEAVSELNRARRTVQMFISPDPLYQEHIKSV